MSTLESRDLVTSKRIPIDLATLPIAFFDLLAPKPSMAILTRRLMSQLMFDHYNLHSETT